MNCIFRLSLGLSTQILKFEDKQAYNMFETGVLVWKSKNMEPYQPLFQNGFFMLKTKWKTHVSKSFS